MSITVFPENIEILKEKLQYAVVEEIPNNL